MTNKEKIQFWKEFQKLNNKAERYSYKNILKVFQKQGSEILRMGNELSFEYVLTRLNDLILESDLQLFFDDFYMKAGKLLLPFYEAQLKKQLTKNVNTINIAFRNQEKINELAKVSTRDDVGHKITSITDYTRTLIRTAITKGISDNLTKKDIASAIRDITSGSISKKRGLLISRTETTFISSITAQINANSTGFKMNKVWIATNDSRTRDAHLEMLNHKPIPQNENFIVGGKEMLYPGDWKGGPENCCNCRCAIAYVPQPIENQDMPKITNRTTDIASALLLQELLTQIL